MCAILQTFTGLETTAGFAWLPAALRAAYRRSACHNPARGGPHPRKILKEGENDILRAMGLAAWRRLTPSIRQRFLKSGSHAGRVTYQGVMERVEASSLGWLLAQFCRLTGTPLAPHRGQKVPVDVDVYPEERGRGLVWARHYFFPGRKPVTVKSAKVLDRHDRLLECVGGGFGMLLDVYEENRALHFVSRRYFWEGLGLRLYLPGLLSPGTAHVIHADLGDDYFRFTITITHKIFGRLFFQDGVFHEKPVKGGL